MNKTIGIIALIIVCGAAVVSRFAFAADQPATAKTQKAILICTGETASPAIVQAADDLAAHAADCPAIKALMDTQGAGPVTRMASEKVLKDWNLAAYNHLVVIGLKSADPLVDKVWEHYAAVEEANKTIYMQGWGHLAGDIGYVESDRNPFLHTRRIKEAPFETVLVRISGTSEVGVLEGVKAFKNGMLNALVPAGEFKRPQQTILDLDPLTTLPEVQLPAVLDGGKAVLAGWTQAPANEYRAYLDLGQPQPAKVWRAKYLTPGGLDKAGVTGWMAGLHRMAINNAVTLVEFATAQEAAKAAAAVGGPGAWHKLKDLAGAPALEANQPIDESIQSPLGKIVSTSRGKFMILSALDPALTAELIGQCKWPG